MELAQFDFDLPEDRIALRPAAPRDHARLLVAASVGPLSDRRFGDLAELLRPGDALVLNDTRVISARLRGARHRGDNVAAIEATLHRRLSASTWSAFARPAKRLTAGDRIVFGGETEGACLLARLDATVKARGDGGEVVLAFDLAGPDLDLAIAERGRMPLPPYIASRRDEDDRDRIDYQTLFAREDGSVAAPTAGLHFTGGLMDRLASRGVALEFITLHVGAGTFLPVKSERVDDHRMHGEWGEITAQTAAALSAVRAAGGRIVCVGTTSLRLLETAAEGDQVRPFAGETSLFITPGYRFRLVDGLITNFHLPRSTLYILAAAFLGLGRIRAVYAHAIADNYRFYSYGDASLLWRS